MEYFSLTYYLQDELDRLMYSSNVTKSPQPAETSQFPFKIYNDGSVAPDDHYKGVNEMNDGRQRPMAEIHDHGEGGHDGHDHDGGGGKGGKGGKGGHGGKGGKGGKGGEGGKDGKAGKGGRPDEDEDETPSASAIIFLSE